MPVEPNRRSYDPRITAELAPPVPMAKDHYWMRAWSGTFLRDKATPQDGPHTEHGEVVSGDDLHVADSGFAAVVPIRHGHEEVVGNHVTEDFIGVPEIREVRVGQGEIGVVVLALVDLHQLLGCFHREPSEEKAVHDAEDGCVGADAECQGQHRHERESRAPG